jgi:signal peptidase I
MFVARRLKKVRHEAGRFVRRARRDLERHPDDFPPAERPKLSREIDRLENEVLPGGDPKTIEREYKELRRQIDVYLPFYRTSVVREYVEIIGVALVLALIIRTFIVQAFKIPSGSMIPTLLVGDHILVAKSLYGIPIPFTEKKIPLTDPKRGDVVVFKFPNDPSKDYIKRIVGIPGDVVEVRGTDVFVNGDKRSHELAGDFNFEDPRGYQQISQEFIETTGDKSYTVLYDNDAPRLDDVRRVVPEGHYFCMGDNRDHSNDSRYWGFVPESYLKGKALFIYFSWPPSQLTRFGHILH